MEVTRVNVPSYIFHHCLQSLIWEIEGGFKSQTTTPAFVTQRLSCNSQSEPLCVSCLDLLPIQELHEGPQYGVSICLCGVAVGRAFDLVQDLTHLTHAAGDTSLETEGRGRKHFCESGGS